ncbi:MAG: peptidase M14 [Deltaproteobacteria bacterium]|nr:MAG: peptidase M14 [Deltaproteobacteria bacterium]
MQHPSSPSQLDERRVTHLDIEDTPRGSIGRFLVHIATDGMGMPIYVPVQVARGVEDGPVLGLTAAIHGNELNGIPVIQRLFREIDPLHLRGTVVGVLVANVPSYLRRVRRFINGKDLNHIMPGRPDGDVSEIYAYRLIDRIIKHFDYLLDLHTASFGRVNSYYIRADLSDPTTRTLAVLQNAQIIVHNPPSDGTLRGAANAMGIPAITLEVGNPNTFQRGYIRGGLTGIHNTLAWLNMMEGALDTRTPEKTIICHRSYWIYSDEGGLLTVPIEVTQKVQKGQVIARIQNIWGDVVREYEAPEEGVIIGKEINPVNQTGGRILHLGIEAVEDFFDTLDARAAKD